MADTWIKIENNTLEKVEVARLSTALAMDRYAVLGRLVRIWSYFDLHSRDGLVEGIDARFIDALVSCPGFCVELSAVGWMRIDERGIALPNFDRHNGGGAKARLLAARRVEKHRTKKTQRYKSNAAPLHAALPEEKREEQKTTDHNSPQGVLPFALPDEASNKPDEATTLAQEFAILGGEGKLAAAISRARANIVDIVSAGITLAAIRAEIHRPGRERSEHPGRMRDRLIPRKDTQHGHKQDAGDFDPNRTDYPSPGSAG